MVVLNEATKLLLLLHFVLNAARLPLSLEVFKKNVFQIAKGQASG